MLNNLLNLTLKTMTVINIIIIHIIPILYIKNNTNHIA